MHEVNWDACNGLIIWDDTLKVFFKILSLNTVIDILTDIIHFILHQIPHEYMSQSRINPILAF